MSVKIMNIQPQTKTTGSYKTEVYDFCIIIVQSLCDTKIWVCFYQMHTQKWMCWSTFYKKQSFDAYLIWEHHPLHSKVASSWPEFFS